MPSRRPGPALEGFEGDVVVLYGDTPLIRPGTLEAMIAARRDGADVVVLGFEAAEPGRYGRLVAEGDRLERIVEWKDATDAERAIRLCNSGVIAADAATLLALIEQVGADNAGGRVLPDGRGGAGARPRGCRPAWCAATRARRWASTPAPSWPPRRPRSRRARGPRPLADGVTIDRARHGVPGP